MAGLWDDINAMRKEGRDPLARAFDTLVQAGPGPVTKAVEKAGEELGAAVRRGDPQAVLMRAYLLVADDDARAGRLLLAEHDHLCRKHGDLAYIRGEAEMRAGYGLLAALKARRWARLAPSLGVSGSVRLTGLRQGAQALILVWVGLAVVAAAAAFRPLPTSWRAVVVVAGFAVAIPGLLRQLAMHRGWGIALGGLFVAVGVAGLAAG